MQQPITKAWCAENPERYHELAQPPECCPLCTEAFSDDRPANSPLLGDSASRCRHWACEACWLHLMNGHPSTWKCPWCREDLRAWMGEASGDAYCKWERMRSDSSPRACCSACHSLRTWSSWPYEYCATCSPSKGGPEADEAVGLGEFKTPRIK